MDDLESLKASLRQYKSRLAAKKAEKQRYLSTASEIEAVYNRMADDKRLIKGYKGSVKNFRDEPFDTFRGDLHLRCYKAEFINLLADYDTVIGNIDDNMDMLNTERARYENKAYMCNGIIGSLQATVNSLIRTIENWVN